MKDFVLDLDRPRKLVFDFDAWNLIADKYGAKKEKGERDETKAPDSAEIAP